jgi:4-diphosphocytidyl-2C-methyl-D-erythritol kinase
MSPDELYALTDQSSGPIANFHRFVCWEQTKRKSIRLFNTNQFTSTHTHFQVVCRKVGRAREAFDTSELLCRAAYKHIKRHKTEIHQTAPHRLNQYENCFGNKLIVLNHKNNKKSPNPAFITGTGSYCFSTVLRGVS